MRETLEKWHKERKRVCLYLVNETVVGKYKSGVIESFDDTEGPDKGIIFLEFYSGAKIAVPYSSILCISEYPNP